MKEKKERKPLNKSSIAKMVIDKFGDDVNGMMLGIEGDPLGKWDCNRRTYYIVATVTYKGSGTFDIFAFRNRGMGSEKKINYLSLTKEERIAIEDYISKGEVKMVHTKFEKSLAYPNAQPHEYDIRCIFSKKKFPILENYLPDSWREPNPSWAYQY